MGTASGIGIGIGVGIVIGIAVTMLFVAINQGTITIEDIPVLEDIPALDFDDARLARLQADYNEETDRLQVVVILTDSNGEYTKANGNGNLYVKKDTSLVHSDNFSFKKDDFVTWKNSFTGEKVTGYMFSIKKYFPQGSHDVFVDLNIGDKYWEELHVSFYSAYR